MTFLDDYYPDPNTCEPHAYVGASWTSMKEDETKKEFKARVEAEIDRVFGAGTSDDCCTIEEGYYNG